MINVSLVLYHPDIEEVNAMVNRLQKSSVVHRIFQIDNSVDNVGYGAGHNKGIRQTIEEGVKYHLVANTDIEFEPGTLEKMVDYMENHPEVGLLSPKVFYPNGEVQYLCKMLPSPIDLIGRRFLPQSWTQKRNKRFELRQTGYDKEMNIPYLSGCFMLLRTEALKKVGLFDERFFMYPEDIDLTRRIHKEYKTIFYPEAKVIHNHKKASYKSRRYLWIHIVNMCKYFNKWGWTTIRDSERRQVNSRLLEKYGK